MRATATARTAVLGGAGSATSALATRSRNVSNPQGALGRGVRKKRNRQVRLPDHRKLFPLQFSQPPR